MSCSLRSGRCQGYLLLARIARAGKIEGVASIRTIGSLRRNAAVVLLGVVLVACGGTSDPAETRVGPAVSPARSLEPAQLPEAAAGSDFYSLPDAVPPGEPGRVVRLQALEVPQGIRGWRVLYHSRAVDGRDIVVSGLVFAPDAPYAPAEGAGTRPVIAWAHGSVGLGDKCAPSKYPEALIGQPVLRELLARGYVVAATDYEGLGTPGPHPWLVGQSEGRSVLDIVRAAARIPEAAAGERFIALGASQGGGAALFAGELAGEYAKELKLLGVVAAAPAAELELLALIPDGNLVGASGFVVMGAFGFYAAYPNLPLEEILESNVISDRQGIESLCQGEIERRFRGVSLERILMQSPGAVSEWAAAVAQNSPGKRPTPAPVLLVHGDRDQVVPVEVSRLLLGRLCGLGVEAETRVYAGIGHLGIMDASGADVLKWITDRISGTKYSAGETSEQSC